MLGFILILIGIILLILEVFTVSTFLVFIAIGFFAAGIASYFISSYIILIIIGIAVSTLGVTLLRNKYLEKITKSSNIKTSYEELLDKEGTVIRSFKGRDVEVGLVKAGNMEWSAQSDENEEFIKGQRVRIVRIDGVKLIVERIK